MIGPVMEVVLRQSMGNYWKIHQANYDVSLSSNFPKDANLHNRNPKMICLSKVLKI
jgi:hypothetical protein